MKRDDVRDEALGRLLRNAVEKAARASTAAARPLDRIAQAERKGPALSGLLPWSRSRKIAWASSAAAAILIAALGIPALQRQGAARAEIFAAAEDLSRILVRDTYTLLAELPVRTEVEQAAVDFAQSLMTTDRDL